MTQMGFFDVENRYATLDAKHDPLVKINAVVPWETFRSRLESVWRKPPDQRKSDSGRKPWDAIVMFKAIILCALYNLSDDQVEYQMRDRLSFDKLRTSSFVRFLGLALEDKVPDAKTVWLYREQLSQAGLIEVLFDDFDAYLKSQGYQAMGGQIMDASIVSVPVQRNSRDENEQIILRLRSGAARPLRSGPTSRPSIGKRTRTHAGRRSTARATTAIRITLTSTASTSWSGVTG